MINCLLILVFIFCFTNCLLSWICQAQIPLQNNTKMHFISKWDSIIKQKNGSNNTTLKFGCVKVQNFHIKKNSVRFIVSSVTVSSNPICTRSTFDYSRTVLSGQKKIRSISCPWWTKPYRIKCNRQVIFFKRIICFKKRKKETLR